MREHVQFGHPNYSWSRVVCTACESGRPVLPLAIQTAEQVQGSISKQFLGEQEDSSDEEPARKKSIFD